MNTQIYVCYHKHSPIPQSDILFPIHVGRSLSQVDLGFSGDDTKDNISSKNKHFCELTATYWIWKNSRADIKGLFHYRRFFNLKSNDTKFNKITDSFSDDFGLDENNINYLMSENDVILPLLVVNPPKKNPPTIYEHYTREHIKSDMDCLLSVINEKYPHMSIVTNRTIRDETDFYGCNMLIAKKEIFDEYAKWLFDIMFEVEKRIQADVLTRDTYQQRAYGFLAERMMRIFIEYKKETSNIKIKEVPLLYLEEDNKKWRKYQLKKIKHKILKFLKLKKDA